MAPSIIVLPVAPGTELPFAAGAVGVTIQMPADIIQSLTGASAAEFVIVGPTGIRHVVTATPSEDGSNATYSTLATDFPLAGTYTLQMQATFTGEVLYSSEFSLTVGPRL